MSKGFGVLCSTLGIVLIGLVVLLCLPLTVPRLLGFEVYAIVSGSMEPAIPTGSVVYARQTAPETVEAGDVIVFYGKRNASTVVTHRVVENDAEAREFVTRGDANDGNDVTPVAYEHLIGEVKCSVPVLGTVLAAISTLRGKIYLLCVIMAGALLNIAGGRLRTQP